MMFWWGQGMNSWGFALMSVSVVLFWGVGILGIVALARYLGRSSPSAGASVPRPSAEQVLAERFARGEIDEPEYTSRLAALRDRAAVEERRVTPSGARRVSPRGGSRPR